MVQKVEDIKQQIINTYGEEFNKMFNLNLGDFLFFDGYFDLVGFCRAINNGTVGCVDLIHHKYGKEGFTLLNLIINNDFVNKKDFDPFLAKSNK